MAAKGCGERTGCSDEQLVRRVLDGDREAFGELYERYLPRVYRYVARRTPSRADAEELTQDVFLNLFASIDSFRGEAPFGAWVFGVVRRTVANRFKRAAPAAVPLAESDIAPAVAARAMHAPPDPHQVLEYRERLAGLLHAIEHDLSDEQRHLFRLHHIQRRSIQEIAQRFHKSQDAVKSHLYRARRVLLAR